MTNLAPNSCQKCEGYSIRGLANWILDEADKFGFPITNMALNKLCYFLYEAFLISREVPLSQAKIEAWEHGPVFREIYQSFKQHGDQPISTRALAFDRTLGSMTKAEIAIDPNDESFLREQLLPLLPLSASRLRSLSHVENGPWWRVWWYDGDVNPGMEITPELILEQGGRRS